MTAHEALLEACRLAPDDDGPRLVWADAVGGERGELVVIQCDLARGGLAPAEVAVRRRRERELLARHGAAWSGLDGFRARYEFRRGFVEAIEVVAPALAYSGEEIFRRAPLLRSATATALTVEPGQPLHLLRELIASPTFWRLHGVHLHGVGSQAQAFDYDPGFEGRGDEAARLLAESGALAYLGALGISSSGLTAAGVHHLVASGELAHLERLWLRGHELGGDAILAVLARTPHLSSLDLHGVTELEAFAPALPPVAELHLSGITDETLAALGRSRAAATVEKLQLSLGTLESCDGFGAFPRLRALDLHGTLLGDPERCALELVAARPTLRRVRFAWLAPASAIRIVARALGPQLEELDVRDTADSPDVIAVLQAHVAGEVIEDAPEGEPLF
jgi:uncharacterized protein (TIGR02996 family)